MIKIRQAQEMKEGIGVIVKRLMPIPNFRNFDPFVLWDDFRIPAGAGLPDHPHRGFEAVTYLFAGSLRHSDNLGNQSTIYSGGAQRFTAGKGLIHSEMPHQSKETRGIQLWINLPQHLKKVTPDYQQVDQNEFPIDTVDGGTIKTIVGSGSPLRLLTPVRYQEIILDEGAQYSFSIDGEQRGFAYLAEGEIKLHNDKNVQETQALFLEHETGVTLTALKKSRLMLCLGTPHNETIVQYGPFVD